MYKKLIEKEEFCEEKIEGFQEWDNARKVVVGKCFDIHNNIVCPYWKSYDPSSNNFHIVPKNERKEFEAEYEKIKKKIIEINANKRKITGYGRSEGSVMHGKGECAEQHKWIEIKDKKISFILSFQTLAFDENNQLNCYLDRIQFYAFPASMVGPNRYKIDGKFEVMYPKNEVGKICIKDTEIIYNTKFSVKSNPEEIAVAFLNFVECVEKISLPQIY